MTFATQHLGLSHQQEQQPALAPQDLSSVAPEELQQVVQQLLAPLAGELHLGLQLAQQQYWEQRAVDAGYAPGNEGMDIAEATAEMYLTELLHQVGTETQSACTCLTDISKFEHFEFDQLNDIANHW